MEGRARIKSAHSVQIPSHTVVSRSPVPPCFCKLTLREKRRERGTKRTEGNDENYVTSVPRTRAREREREKGRLRLFATGRRRVHPADVPAALIRLVHSCLFQRLPRNRQSGAFPNYAILSTYLRSVQFMSWALPCISRQHGPTQIE